MTSKDTLNRTNVILYCFGLLLGLVGVLFLIFDSLPFIQQQAQEHGQDVQIVSSHPLSERLSDLPLTSTHNISSSLSLLYLPFIESPDTFFQNDAIWAHTNIPTGTEVSLFRSTFHTNTPITQTHIRIFADTRYQLWVDGVWVGRGPARFLYALKEYDTFNMSLLSPGSHVIAVLVQWAPGVRRSESTRPLLQAAIEGRDQAGYHILDRTGPHWKVLRSEAWREDAAPVHAWQLIGPTELLDLRSLPADWMKPTFSDANWLQAVQISNPATTYQPRSIPFLVDEPVTYTIKDSGLLSPGFRLGEFALNPQQPYQLSFSADSSLPFTIETLSTITPIPDIALDGQMLAFTAEEPRHPDILTASQTITSGEHQLVLTSTTTYPFVALVSEQHTHAFTLPFTQSNHVGYRLLLANPVTQEHASQVTTTALSSTITFMQTPAYIIVDIGRIIQGRMVADIQGPAGTIVDIGWDERLWNGRIPLSYPGSLHLEWNQTDSWILDGTTRTISTIDTRTGRYIFIAVWGVHPVTLENLRIYEERYPVVQTGQFHASDPLLNKIWQIGIDTLRINMTDAYADPWRERGQWWGDAFIADRVNQVAFGDTLLLRRALLFMVHSFHKGKPPSLVPGGEGAFLFDYGMLWIQSVDDYWRLTRDKQTLQQIYPVLNEFMDFLATQINKKTHLLDVPEGDWHQTSVIDWAAKYDRYGQSTALNAIYYNALMNASSIAHAMGNTYQANVWLEQARHLKTQINTFLYNKDSGHYFASIVGDMVHSPTPQAQAWALTYGVVPEEEQQRVADSLIALLSTDPMTPNVEIYGMFWVLEALGRTHRLSEAQHLIKNSYGRLLELGATSWWENFNSYLSYKQALSHAWGGSPTWFLTRYVLGAERTGPNAWIVQPGLRESGILSGSIPLAQGTLLVTWTYTSEEKMHLEVVAPSESSGEVMIPHIQPYTTIKLNGEVIWQQGIPFSWQVFALLDTIYIPLSEGKHTLDIY